MPTRKKKSPRRKPTTVAPASEQLAAASRLASGIAHDLNNLLSVINGYSDLVATRVADDPEATREISEIQEAGRKAALLTQQLLAFSRQRPSQPCVVDLHQFLRIHEGALRTCAGHATLIFKRARKIAHVRIDPEHLLEVLSHLIRNAQDALPKNGRVVLTTASRTVRRGPRNRRSTDISPGLYAGLRVEDEGAGLKAEARQHLFEPFFSTKPEGRASGMSLALAHSIVEQSGGFLNLLDTGVTGTIFEILLPSVRAPARAASVVPKSSLQANTRGTEKILIIEEDPLVRKMLEGILTADGYEAQAFGNEQDATRSLDSRPGAVHLLIADGVNVAKSLRSTLSRNHPQIRVLHLSGRDLGSALHWLPPTHWRSLAKPFALSELLRATRELLDQDN